MDINSPNTRELKEYKRNFPLPEQANHNKHLMQIVGIIATDMGWGLIVRAERDQFGNYAKPLGQHQNDKARH
ncbi:YrbL family protein [uncultured Bartonella sp.]|uniref:YrbL family protein n=1 Tax=uncultured Bartonella sp. TaxID=104108 RepID=UPI002608F6E5|nr:YrbL family protein [uncultured Bartonella sp.]